MYINLRCRKCGQYLSMETDYPYSHGLGYVLKKDNHNCLHGINDDEKIFCDLISISEKEPLGEMIKTLK